MFIGIVFLILGLAFLLKNVGVLTGITWSVVWPILIIVLGFLLIFKKRKRIWE